MRDLKDQLVGLDPRFRYRGLNQTRIETFSDAVFAFSVTLVVLSSSVPQTFDQLRESLTEIIPFLICVILIVVIWFQHYIFFLRYGLQDTKTVTINTILLFVLLIYVYPLKFLAKFLTELYYGFIFGIEEGFMSEFGGTENFDVKLLMAAYGMGATAIFLSLSWLYRHAYNRREQLEMDEYEVFSTRVSLWQNLLMSSIPFMSTVIILISPFGHGPINYSIAGFIYMLYPPVMMIFGRRVNKKSKQLFGEA